MDQNLDLFHVVHARLRQTKYSSLPDVAKRSGVPESTLKKIRSGEVRNPRINTVQALYEYFRAQHPTQEAEHA